MSTLATPALPLHTAGKYVAAAYIVFFALILIYVAIMAMRLNRIERDLGDLLERFPAAPPEPGLPSANLEPRASVDGEPVVHGEPVAHEQASAHQESARV
jgi:hypothetical protein